MSMVKMEGGELLSVYLTQMSMVKMVKLKMEVREEVINFLFT